MWRSGVVHERGATSRFGSDRTQRRVRRQLSSGITSPFQEAMVKFIELHPNWDQYRLVQAALAGFLVQNGIESREITRVYVGNMFRRESLLNGV